MFTYHQKSGQLFHNGELVGIGYSGHAEGVNNPALEADAGIGPIPRGKWRIGPAHFSQHTGPVTMDLEPVPPNTAHGRSLFRMHGDNSAGNESASRGCIIMDRAIREKVATSWDRDLEVVA